MNSTKIFAGIIVGLWVAVGATLMITTLVGLTELLIHDRWPQKMWALLLAGVWIVFSGLGWTIAKDFLKKRPL